MEKHPNPTPPADDSAKSIARDLMSLRHAALSYIGKDGFAGISRIAFGQDKAGVPLTLISALAPHFAGLQTHPSCAVMLGEPGPKGDPLTHPRLMLRAKAMLADPMERPVLRALWLETHPKAKLYIDFTDFDFVRFHPISGLLNGGFGKAFTLSGVDLLAKP